MKTNFFPTATPTKWFENLKKLPSPQEYFVLGGQGRKCSVLQGAYTCSVVNLSNWRLKLITVSSPFLERNCELEIVLQRTEVWFPNYCTVWHILKWKDVCFILNQFLSELQGVVLEASQAKCMLQSWVQFEAWMMNRNSWNVSWILHYGEYFVQTFTCSKK